MPSFGKILWSVFEKISEHTDRQTHKGQSIGPSSRVGGSKKQVEIWIGLTDIKINKKIEIKLPLVVKYHWNQSMCNTRQIVWG